MLRDKLNFKQLIVKLCRDVAKASRGNCCKLVLLRSKRSSESICHKSGTASNCGLCDRSKVRRFTTCVNDAICCREFACKFNVSNDSGCVKYNSIM
uniref:Uncharacterized protein n=1 Tax=Glossina pallidipes TaxID=7398 RepID=A0A1A9ZCC8_GLOPL